MMRRLTDYQAIIVDLDGTLYYQRPVRLAMLKEMLLHFWRLPDFLIVQKYRKLYEQGISEAGRFAQLPEKAPQVIHEWMIKRPLPYIAKYRDGRLIDLLVKANDAGSKIIVYSDYPVEEKLIALQYEPNGAYCAQDTGFLKPDASGLVDIIYSFGAQPEECLIIGDRNEKDGKMAANMGAESLILSSKIQDRKEIYEMINI